IKIEYDTGYQGFTSAEAALIASAVQPGDLAAVAFSGDYDDLTNVPSTFPPAAHTHNASDINAGTLSDARLPSEMSAKEFATALGSIRIGGGTGDYRTYNFTTRQSQATWYFDRSIVQYLEFRRHENGSSFSSPFRFDFRDDSLSVAGAVTVGGNAGISGTLAVGGTLSWGGGNPIASSDDVADVDSGSFTATLTGVSGTVQGTINWYRVGRLVTLYSANNITGTANAIGMSLQQLPASLRPTQTRDVPSVGMVADNAAGRVGRATVLTNGGISFAYLETGGVLVVFPSTGTKGLEGGWSITYLL